jgi:predicted porin
LVVARITAPWNSPWHLGIRGDVGGFGAGSKLTWQINPSAGYKLSNNFELWLAYRWIRVKYNAGEANEFFEYDISIFGPELGVLWNF